MSPDVITIINYLEYGKKAPKYSNYKGVVTTTSIVGYKEYTKRSASKKLSKEAQKAQENNSYLGYTTRFGAEKTFSSIGWLDTKEKNEQFKNKIAQSFNKDGDIIWEGVISLRDFKTGSMMKLCNEEDYAAVFSKMLPKWFDRSLFDKDNMHWWMDYHVNTDNPHIHLNFFEIEKTKKNEQKKLPMKQINDFKNMFWNEVFATKRYLEETGESVEEGFKSKDILKKETYQSFKENLLACTDQEFIFHLKELYQKLPHSGRLQYNSSHMIPYRHEIDNIVDRLLKMPGVEEKYKSFVACVKKFDEVKSENLHTTFGIIYNQEDKKLRAILANEVLREFKNVDQKFWNREVNVLSDTTDIEQKHKTVNTSKNHMYHIPVANSLVTEKNDITLFTRIPGTKLYVDLDSRNSILINENKKFRIVNISENQEFHLYTKLHVDIGKVISAHELLDNFDDGSNILTSYYQMLENKEIWELKMKNYMMNEHDWQQNVNSLQRASFSWMNEVEQEVDRSRTKFLYGREMDLS